MEIDPERIVTSHRLDEMLALEIGKVFDFLPCINPNEAHTTVWGGKLFILTEQDILNRWVEFFKGKDIPFVVVRTGNILKLLKIREAKLLSGQYRPIANNVFQEEPPLPAVPDAREAAIRAARTRKIKEVVFCPNCGLKASVCKCDPKYYPGKAWRVQEGG